jgi:RNA polymerase sigma-70 factor (ECF subfamily)
LSQGEGLALWRRLLAADDPTARSDFAVAYLDWLADWLIHTNPRADPHDCNTAAEDAVLDLLKHPERYQPDRGRLDAYLCMAAARDLSNLWRKEGRHRRRRADLEVVELSPREGKYLQSEADDPARRLEEAEDAAELGAALASAVAEGLTSEEACVLDLWRSGERKGSVFAAALGLSRRPIDEQRREVKQVKDRLKKRMQRARERYE